MPSPPRRSEDPKPQEGRPTVEKHRSIARNVQISYPSPGTEGDDGTVPQAAHRGFETILSLSDETAQPPEIVSQPGILPREAFLQTMEVPLVGKPGP
jgi:hypothetical protein